ncbi:DUF1244 domain-containing protein [Thalassospira sp.]|uniref:DUF1244 domain-containing protein n=1 Tax=Thalassospira sp. TaxID=1912094 RepID=UPI0027360FBD|nr:DUF1244 domain-containing protein [Thalassospira sp.]MDP2698477.1 DUF1244 domain-containing protein [Thalassospira sp.]
MSDCAGSNIPAIDAIAAPKGLDAQTRTELEAAAFRGLVAHLQNRTDVQNIDLMNLAGFCRNCLAKWYLAAARQHGVDLDYDGAREVVYGMTYDDWKDRHQRDASDEQKRIYAETTHLHAVIPGAK